MEITTKKLFEWMMKGIALILVLSVVFGVGAFVYTKYFVAPSYVSNVKFYASGSPENKGQLLAEYYQTVAPQYIEFLNVNEFYEMVAQELEEKEGIFATPKEIASTIRFSAIIQDTSSFFVEVETSDPTLSYNIAMCVAELAPQQIQNFENVGALEVLSNPAIPVAPSGPSLLRNTLLGVIVGFLLGAGIVVLKELMDNRIKDPDEITELFGLPVFGIVPDFNSNKKKGGR